LKKKILHVYSSRQRVVLALIRSRPGTSFLPTTSWSARPSPVAVDPSPLASCSSASAWRKKGPPAQPPGRASGREVRDKPPTPMAHHRAVPSPPSERYELTGRRGTATASAVAVCLSTADRQRHSRVRAHAWQAADLALSDRDDTHSPFPGAVWFPIIPMAHDFREKKSHIYRVLNKLYLQIFFTNGCNFSRRI